jgi:hypothetical protein
LSGPRALVAHSIVLRLRWFKGRLFILCGAASLFAALAHPLWMRAYSGGWAIVGASNAFERRRWTQMIYAGGPAGRFATTKVRSGFFDHPVFLDRGPPML